MHVLWVPISRTKTPWSPGKLIHRTAVRCGGLLASLFYRWHQSMESWMQWWDLTVVEGTETIQFSPAFREYDWGSEIPLTAIVFILPSVFWDYWLMGSLNPHCTPLTFLYIYLLSCSEFLCILGILSNTDSFWGWFFNSRRLPTCLNSLWIKISSKFFGRAEILQVVVPDFSFRQWWISHSPLHWCIIQKARQEGYTFCCFSMCVINLIPVCQLPPSIL